MIPGSGSLVNESGTVSPEGKKKSKKKPEARDRRSHTDEDDEGASSTASPVDGAMEASAPVERRLKKAALNEKKSSSTNNLKPGVRELIVRLRETGRDWEGLGETGRDWETARKRGTGEKGEGDRKLLVPPNSVSHYCCFCWRSLTAFRVDHFGNEELGSMMARH